MATLTNRELLKQIAKNQTQQQSQCKSCQDMVKTHDKTLNGNGSMGMKTKVGILFWVLTIGGSATGIALGGLLARAFVN